jgi:DNA modification methylase
MTTYADFLQSKAAVDPATGLREIPALNPKLFPFQRDIVRWALRRGRAAIFADCGLGKTPMQLEWAQHVPGNVLILAPLAVAAQTKREGEKFDIPVGVARSQADVAGKITVTNYEMLDRFDPSQFQGIVLDESSILKAHDGATRNAIIESFAATPFRLACTATPAPNDHMELANHSEFLGAMSRTEMLAMFFVHDGGDTSKWRIKGHGREDFWKWVCSWAVMLRKPSDLGYEDDGFRLPGLGIQSVVVDAPKDGLSTLFPVEAQTLQERLAARRESIDARVRVCADLVNATDEPFLVFCNLNDESDRLRRGIAGAVEVKGSDPHDQKERNLLAFANGEIRVLVSKPRIAGYGLNLQHCSKMAFVGLSDSYEQFYQAVRRCWRFGQVNPVTAYVITCETEGRVVENIKRKERDAQAMARDMVANMHEINEEAIKGVERDRATYTELEVSGEGWKAHQGDCVEVIKTIPDESIGLSIYSPPFASLYTYSNSDRDMGNSKNEAMFFEHYQFLIREKLRVTQPGRLSAVHCMNLPMSYQRHGEIGIIDFRGRIIKAHEEAGWIFHSEVCIWKDPVTAMQRTKALGLLWKQLKKDSTMSRMGIPDYVVVFRKPGENDNPVRHTPDEFPVAQWQRWASPIWDDINPSDTLQFRSAREHEDERHICPLQLEVIRRALVLWSNPEDLVLSPFMGIGSEGVVALEQGRRFVGIELKSSYYSQACANLAHAKRLNVSLFDAPA